MLHSRRIRFGRGLCSGSIATFSDPRLQDRCFPPVRRQIHRPVCGANALSRKTGGMFGGFTSTGGRDHEQRSGFRDARRGRALVARHAERLRGLGHCDRGFGVVLHPFLGGSLRRAARLRVPRDFRSLGRLRKSGGSDSTGRPSHRSYFLGIAAAGEPCIEALAARMSFRNSRVVSISSRPEGRTNWKEVGGTG